MSEPGLRWRYHPLKDSPRLSAVLLAVVLGLALLTVRYVGSLTYSLPLVTAFLLSFRRWFLPTDYRLDRDGVEVTTPLGRSFHGWHKFRAFREAPGSLLLTRLARPSALDRLYGLELRFAPAMAGQVKELVGGNLARPGTELKSERRCNGPVDGVANDGKPALRRSGTDRRAGQSTGAGNASSRRVAIHRAGSSS